MSNRFAAVRKIAKRLVESNQLEPPIDIEKIYRKMNIKIEEKENQYGIEAYSYLNDDIRVVINSEITFRPRRRFTLAHELGHICIPWHNGDTKCIAGENFIQISGKRFLDTQELEANMFASEFLMPTQWVRTEIEENLSKGFTILVNNIIEIAQTSIMACFFALENAFDSGHIFFVKRLQDEYWKAFKGKNTCTISWGFLAEQNMIFLDEICENKEICKISQYQVVYYKVLECPEQKYLAQKYCDCQKDLLVFLKSISNNNIIKTFPFLDVVVNSISDKYVIFIICNGEVIRVLCQNNSPLRMFYRGLEYKKIMQIAKYNELIYKYERLSKSYSILYVKERVFNVPKSIFCDPNRLLKSIVRELYCDDEAEHMLKSINGVVAGMNSSFIKSTREELYNWLKYRFLTDERFSEFVEHENFEKYIVNKIDKMILMRK